MIVHAYQHTTVLCLWFESSVNGLDEIGGSVCSWDVGWFHGGGNDEGSLSASEDVIEEEGQCEGCFVKNVGPGHKDETDKREIVRVKEKVNGGFDGKDGVPCEFIAGRQQHSIGDTDH